MLIHTTWNVKHDFINTCCKIIFVRTTCQIRLTISLQFGLAVWFRPGRELPPHPCSLAWIRAGRAAISPLRVNKAEPTWMYCMQISLIQDIKVQHNLRIYSDSRGIRIPNPDWARGGAGDGGGWLAPEKRNSCWWYWRSLYVYNDRRCISIGRRGSDESPLMQAWLTWPARTGAWFTWFTWTWFIVSSQNPMHSVDKLNLVVKCYQICFLVMCL